MCQHPTGHLRAHIQDTPRALHSHAGTELIPSLCPGSTAAQEPFTGAANFATDLKVVAQLSLLSALGVGEALLTILKMKLCSSLGY